MYENKQIPQNIPHRLFVLKVPADKDKNEYDVVLSTGTVNGQPIIPNDMELCISLYDLMYMNTNPGFNINACLDYHYNFSEDKEYFLEFVKEALTMQHLDWPSEPYTDYRHKKVLDWFIKMNDAPNIENGGGPIVVGHKIVLLYELGIIEYLKKEYFSLLQSERTDTDFAKLIAYLIGEKDKTENIRRAISGIKTGKKNDPATPPAIRQVKSYLATLDIDLKRLTDPD